MSIFEQVYSAVRLYSSPRWPVAIGSGARARISNYRAKLDQRILRL